MKYESIEKWLEECPRPEMYDFVEDTQDLQKISEAARDYGEIKDVYKKFFIYKFNACKPSDRPKWGIIEKIEEDWKNEFRINIRKFLEEAKKYEEIGDPDTSSSLLQAVYKRLWPELVNKSFMMTCKGSIYSDTMTSAMTRFSDAMKLFIHETHPEEKELPPENAEVWLKTIRKIRSIHKACGSRQRWWSINFSIIVFACLGEEDRKIFYQMIESKYPDLPRFLDICHGIGNYCPVPGGFNGARSGSYADHDYWDLTLMKIREWYLAADKMSMYERDQLLSADLLHNGGNALFCMRWLECFGQGETGWRNFVDTLVMRDLENGCTYVDKETDEVVPFWKKHGWKKDPDPEKSEIIGMPADSTEEINNGLKEICGRIEARSNKIVKMLKEQR